MRLASLIVSLSLLAPSLPALAAPPAPTGDPTVSASWRLRIEAWDWFRPDTGDGEYVYAGSLLRLGIARARPSHDWQLELAIPNLIGLPRDAIAPPPQGQLGLGATYRAANGDRVGSLFAKQGFWRVRRGIGPGNQLRLGRFEFVEGLEVIPQDASLAWLKRERIGHRLLGNFAWSHVGRSLDGGQFTHQARRTNLTFVAARPTEGVFQLNGWEELEIRVLYGAATLAQPGRADMRLFVLDYKDDRDALKVDNRPAAARAADTRSIDVTTFGGHYVRVVPVGASRVDLLLWGALQTGDWGVQSHRANAGAAEVGFQPRSRLRPWVRAGYYRSSGDDDPTDDRHETFFQVLPTPRVYARFPFYNGMNSEDLFLQAIVRPGRRWTVRADARRLRLTEGADLWYSGGGAFQSDTFGYAGRPGNGERGLATLYDVSADYALNPQTTLAFYLGAARGGEIIRRIYPRGENATLAYLELSRRW
jgi:hypothetical protein